MKREKGENTLIREEWRARAAAVARGCRRGGVMIGWSGSVALATAKGFGSVAVRRDLCAARMEETVWGGRTLRLLTRFSGKTAWMWVTQSSSGLSVEFTCVWGAQKVHILQASWRLSGWASVPVIVSQVLFSFVVVHLSNFTAFLIGIVETRAFRRFCHVLESSRQLVLWSRTLAQVFRLTSERNTDIWQDLARHSLSALTLKANSRGTHRCFNVLFVCDAFYCPFTWVGDE